MCIYIYTRIYIYMYIYTYKYIYVYIYILQIDEIGFFRVYGFYCLLKNSRGKASAIAGLGHASLCSGCAAGRS